MADFAHQDWNTVVVRKKPTGGGSGGAAGGGSLTTDKKYGAGGNRQGGAGKDARKLEEDTENFKHEKVSFELKKRIAQARQAKGLTTKELAQKLNVKPAIVNDYEQGKVIPDNAVLGKMERALGVKLRGKPGGAAKAGAAKKKK